MDSSLRALLVDFCIIGALLGASSIYDLRKKAGRNNAEGSAPSTETRALQHFTANGDFTGMGPDTAAAKPEAFAWY